MTLKNNRAPLLCILAMSSFVHHSVAIGEFKLELTIWKHSIQVKIGNFLLCDLENLLRTLIYFRATFLCYFKLGTSFHSHRWIQTGVTVWKHLIQVKIGHVLSCVTLKFDGWCWKTIGHLFYATSSFVHHFITLCEFKLELLKGWKWLNWV